MTSRVGMLAGLMRRCRRGDWEAAMVLRDWALENGAEMRVATALVKLQIALWTNSTVTFVRSLRRHVQ